MNQTFEDRMQAVEDELKEIRGELEGSLARYKQSQYPFTAKDVQLYINGEKFDG